MATYRKGKETHDAILEAAKQLFFSKGYTSTYNKDIADLAKVNVGLIHYYYQTKGRIALDIYMELLSSHLQMVQDYFQDEETPVLDAIAIRLLWQMLAKSPEFLRFMHEINSERIPLQMSDYAAGRDYTRELSEHIVEQDEEMLRLLCRCSIAAEMELIDSFAEGTCQYSAEELAELDERMTLQISSVPKETIDRILKRSHECIQGVIMEIGPKFKLILR